MKKRLFIAAVAAAAGTLVTLWAADGGEFGLGPLNRLFASLGFFFFFLQFVLSSRVRLIERGFGLDAMIRLHRQTGRLALGFLLLHVLLLLTNEIIRKTVSFNLFRLIGAAVLMGLLVTAFVASSYKRLKWPYELWLNIHKTNYLLFPLALIHVFYNRPPRTPLAYAWAAIALLFFGLLAHKAFREWMIRKYPYEVTAVRQEAKDIWTLFFRGRPFIYKPGQFLYLRLEQNGRLSSPHPFTITSSPTWDAVSVTPKESGDFTSTVKDIKTGDKAYLDAPFGMFSYLNYPCDSAVFIAGGIGITPFISMLRYMRDTRQRIPVILLWGNKNEESLCFRDELEDMEREMEQLRVVPVMSGQDNWPGEKGRIDGRLIQRCVTPSKNCHFFVCGPPPMSRAVLQALRDMGISSKNIQHEMFEM